MTWPGVGVSHEILTHSFVDALRPWNAHSGINKEAIKIKTKHFLALMFLSLIQILTKALR